MTNFFQWDPTLYSVHVDSMDAEHEILISIMNRLHERHEAGAAAHELAGRVKELAGFTVTHFEHEEAYMDSIGFPGLGAHKLIHKDLLERFGEHVSEFEKTGVLSEDFFRFLRRWLKAHIQGIDRRYGEHRPYSESA